MEQTKKNDIFIAKSGVRRTGGAIGTVPPTLLVAMSIKDESSVTFEFATWYQSDDINSRVEQIFQNFRQIAAVNKSIVGPSADTKDYLFFDGKGESLLKDISIGKIPSPGVLYAVRNAAQKGEDVLSLGIAPLIFQSRLEESDCYQEFLKEREFFEKRTQIEENRNKSSIKTELIKNYAFIAMPINPDDPELEDVLDAIKEACKRCGVQAERVDEPESNDRITDRIIESIHKAEYVIVDLSHVKPNVFYEAGYAHGCGKIPIYIAKDGTKLEFDLKDYPIIFFKNMKQLKDFLEKRIRGLSEKRQL